MREQTNATEVDNPRTWAAHSLLRVRGSRDVHGKPIRCLTMHPSSSLPEVAEARLDVHCEYARSRRNCDAPRIHGAALQRGEVPPGGGAFIAARDENGCLRASRTASLRRLGLRASRDLKADRS